MHWESVSQFIGMGGHGFYVWTAWGAGLLALALELVLQSFRRRAALKEIRRIKRLEEAEDRASSEE